MPVNTQPERPRARFHLSTSARWTVAALVVVLALIVAIWPRDSSDPGPSPSGMPTTGSSALPGLEAAVTEDDMAKGREKAALLPCPVATGPTPSGSKLAGVTVPCLADGSAVDLGSATAGTPMLVNVWAHWCGPCRAELPVIDEYAKRAGDRVRVLTVQGKEGAENPFLSLTLLAEIGVHLPTVVDTDAKIAAALGVPRAYPSTVLVRADGTVAAVLPRVFESPDEVADVVRQHLGVDA
ncbi:TlpA disulfide reductase family protein [Williamsia sp. D3]|uniref:TlpA family protein disulfide reductase n=1 Tax=Williamsia sp. D3 TaxID=1313067 RepID=UPI0003D2E340|nr:TlpA disulfide reductase family protein [Williamsia sp. D3]ETD33450.1 alkyl hydroperoxide reductase [Williamsia sp. D3]